jgi:NADP-dependent 3-hydroxy acid dehydrogenase YdfG
MLLVGLMVNFLHGKVVLLTGASSGFDEDAALLFAREGCKVMLTDYRLEKLQALAANIQNQDWILYQFSKKNHELD